MEFFQMNRWMGYFVFGLATFLVFCLLFEPYIELPVAIAWTGRWHPLFVHFPIVLLLIAIFLGIWKKKVPKPLVGIAAISALLTAITGFFLSREVLDMGPVLVSHKWLGSALALVASAWFGLFEFKLNNRLLVVTLNLLLLVLLGAAGHYGGMVTHGEDYLALPAADAYDNIPDNPLIYKDVVHRILKANCLSCHNENKRKGALVMSSIEGLIKGGESGSALVPGDPENSEIIRRLHLATGEEEHMPPEGRKQPKAFEIRILERWIALGASDTLHLDHLEGTEPLYTLVQDLMAPDPMERWKQLPTIADSTLENLSTDYRTIRRIAGNSNALSINVYLPPVYDPQSVTDLARVASNIVELDLSGLPLANAELEFVAACRNLEWLELDGTPITDSDLVQLDGLSQLRLLKLYETDIGDKGITLLGHLDRLDELYLWNTRISNEGLEWLKSKYPKLSINSGIDKETEALFSDTDSIPLPKSDETP